MSSLSNLTRVVRPYLRLRTASFATAAAPPDAKALAEAKKKEDEAKAVARARDVEEGKLNYRSSIEKQDAEVSTFQQAAGNVLEKESVYDNELQAPLGELGFLSGMPDEVRERKAIIKKNVRKTTMSNEGTKGVIKGWTLTWATQSVGQWTNPITGWASGSDPLGRTRLDFDTREQAEMYAKTQNLNYEVRGDNSAREATLEKRQKVQIYDHNFIGPEVTYYLKKHGPEKSKLLWEFEAPGKSYWTNTPRSHYGPDKFNKKDTPSFD